MFGSPATGNQPAKSGLLGIGTKAATDWLGKSYDSLVGKGGKHPVGSYPLNDGGSLFINSDGSQSVMYGDGRVVNYDSKGNQTSSGSTDVGYDPNYSEQALYDAEARAREEAYQQEMIDDYQNYYENYQGYNPYEGYDMNQYEP